MSGKTKFIFDFSRMQPNFMARRDIKLVQKREISKQNIYFFRYYDFNNYLCTIFPTNTVNKDET